MLLSTVKEADNEVHEIGNLARVQDPPSLCDNSGTKQFTMDDSQYDIYKHWFMLLSTADKQQ